MTDILVRNVDEDVARRLKEKAAANGTSLNETARQALTAYVAMSKAEAWEAIDRIREKIGKVSGDSTADIRADRDNANHGAKAEHRPTDCERQWLKPPSPSTLPLHGHFR